MSTKTDVRLPGTLLKRSFFEAPPEQVAPLLLGKLLVRRVGGRKLLAGRIVEVEAYLGPHNTPPDPAAHAHRGPTPRNEVLFGPAGHAYVYSIYGRYFCLNISCETVGRAGCVLLRALEPVAGAELMARHRNSPSHRQGPARGGPGISPGAPPRMLTSGPGRLCQALAITRPAHNGLDLLDAESPLQVRDDAFVVSECLVTARIGIKHAVDRPLRFALPNHECVSGPKSFPGLRIPVR